MVQRTNPSGNPGFQAGNPTVLSGNVHPQAAAATVLPRLANGAPSAGRSAALNLVIPVVVSGTPAPHLADKALADGASPAVGWAPSAWRRHALGGF